MNAKWLTALGLLTIASIIAGSPAWAQDEQDVNNPAIKTADVHGLRPPHETEKLVPLAEEAIQKGLKFLVESQNEDGSWGSHAVSYTHLTLPTILLV